MKTTLRLAHCRPITTAAVALAIFIAGAAPSVAGKRDAVVHVESSPSGSLVSVHVTGDPELGSSMMVAGETPLARTFRFPRNRGLWLRFEKTGYHPRVVEIDVNASRVSVDLVPLDGGLSKPDPVKKLALVTPDLTVIRRGFANEREDEPAGVAAATAIVRAMADHLGEQVETVVFGGDSAEDILRPLWRDARSQMKLLDPIRLPYMSVPPALQSSAARAAAREVAERTGADAVLFVVGRVNLETGGMKAGKIGLMAAGSACSFASGYANAMSSGSDFFTYDIYLPSFAEGLGLETLLIDTRSGVVRWANKGLWKSIPLDNPEAADSLVIDLLTGLDGHLSTMDLLESQEEEE